MISDISKRIADHSEDFSKGQKKIATAVLTQYEKVAYMTASKLGKTVGVSESTVVRFAGMLGYDGYAAFQRAIQELVRTKLTPNQRIEMTKKRIGRGDVLDNVMESDINKIRYTLDNINKESFYKSVDTILESSSVYIMGARSSEPVARILQYNLALIFDNIKFVNPTSSQEVFEQMYSISEKDCLIAFSFPRYSQKIISAVKFARSKSARVIVVTDSDLSPLAEFATYTLTAQSDMASFMDSLVAPISIINAIIVEITNRREKQIVARFDELERLWDKYEVYAKH